MQIFTPSYSSTVNSGDISGSISIQENRVFMFVDMKSSTSIAEQIGSKSYSDLLENYYRVILQSISEFGGEVYQIVGDEIIVTWPLYKSFQNTNPLNCYEAMKDSLKFMKGHFATTYGVVPDFKASIHCGEVTVSHWGFNDNNLVFIGDVLNTASRILNYCKKTEVDLLISGAYCSLLLNWREDFTSIRSIIFRGKKQVTHLYSYAPANVASVLKHVS